MTRFESPEVLHVLLCNIADVKPGSKLAAAVIRTDAPDVELLKPGVKLEQRMLARLKSMGVRHIWIDHDLAADLDKAIDPHVMRMKQVMYRQLRDDLRICSNKCITDAQLAVYQQAITQLVNTLVSSGKIGTLTDSLFHCKGDHMTHGVNVAHLSILIGLQLESYIIRERPRLSIEHARDLMPLGVGAALHDIGKVGLTQSVSGEANASHEAHFSEADFSDHNSQEQYREHVLRGYNMLRECRAPASACQAVLNHHQRFDGTGWPELSKAVKQSQDEPPAGRRIHIFTRIVAAANVLDNLMRTPEGEPRPTVAALSDFASHRYDGWFDPMVRRAALKCIPPFTVGAKVKLSDGRAGVVTCPNIHEPCSPMVRLLEPGNSAGIKPSSQNCQPEQGNVDAEVVDLSIAGDLRIVDCAGVDVSSWHFKIQSGEEIEAERAA